jgi:hypothetical protein
MKLDDKLFWNVGHYKVDTTTGEIILISYTKGVPVKQVKRLFRKAYMNGYRYNRTKGYYSKTTGNFEYQLLSE